MTFNKSHVYAKEYASAAELFEQMDRLRHVWAGFHPAPPLKRSDLTMLANIDDLANTNGKKVTVSMLARRLRQSMPGVSQKVSVLEEMGYIQRVGDTADRRVTHIALTPKGQELARVSLREFLGRTERALDLIGEEKTRQILTLMQELADAIESMQ